jgi:hypothetical protein
MVGPDYFRFADNTEVITLDITPILRASMSGPIASRHNGYMQVP